MKRIFKALSAMTLALTLLLSFGLTALAAEEEVVEGEYGGYLVTLTPPNPEEATLFAEDITPEGLTALDSDNYIYKAATLEELQDLVYAGRVRRVEPDYKVELFDLVPTEPNDPYFKNNTGSTGYQYNLGVIQAQSAWDAGLSGDGVTVAVIDTGLNLNHVDAPVKVAPGRYYFYLEEAGGRYEFGEGANKKAYNYYSSSNVTDEKGHGSMVAGIIAANTNNGKGIAGIAPGVTILPIKCFTSQKGHLSGMASNMISGLTYARTHGADIINMSWGFKNKSETLREAIDAASNAGCILVAAAGNEGSNAPNYPACYDNVISVGATDKENKVAYFSQQDGSTLVSAPGVQIYSLHSSSNTDLGYGPGTSYAAPMVAAAAALLKEADPSMTHQDFAALLIPANCDPIVAGDYQQYGGNGILNIKKLLDATGYAGASYTLSQTGLTLRGACHPKSGAGAGAILLAAIYNEQGHLLESQVASVDSVNKWGTMAESFIFNDVSQAHSFQVFFLANDSTLAATNTCPRQILKK